MTPDESAALLRLLAQAYPRFDMPEASASLYQQLLTPLDYWIAERAAMEWVQEEKWFPTVAELREYARKARRELESEALLLAARAADPEPPHVPDQEVAEMIRAALRAWTMADIPEDFEVQEHPVGPCSDCGVESDVLISYGASRRPLCPTCLAARLRVAAKLAEAERS